MVQFLMRNPLTAIIVAALFGLGGGSASSMFRSPEVLEARVAALEAKQQSEFSDFRKALDELKTQQTTIKLETASAFSELRADVKIILMRLEQGNPKAKAR